MTLSSHASIFTGLYCRSHGAHFGEIEARPRPGTGLPLAGKFRTLAEILSEKGYRTLGVSANYAYLGHDFNLDQGFEYYDARRAVAFLGYAEPYTLRRGVRDLLTAFASPASFDVRTRRASEINREVYRQLDRMNASGERFFLFVNYMDAHEPYIPPAPFDTLYPGKDRSFTMADHRSLIRAVGSLAREVTDEELQHLVSQYDGGIAYIDHHLGELFQRLRDMDLYDDTLIIVFSDHGQHFGERRLFGHGISVYQGLVRVPLVIKYPGVRSPAIVDDVVSGVDILPTVLDVLGYGAPDGVQGVSLARAAAQRPIPVISESFPSGPMRSMHPRFDRVERALFRGAFKLIRSSSGKRELYDLRRDPAETTSVSAEPEVARRLDAELDRFLETLAPEFGSTVDLDEEALERLRSLGYVQ
jgi:arylsulfatase A-like enzyme